MSEQVVVNSVLYPSAGVAEQTVGIVLFERARQTAEEFQDPSLGLHLSQGWDGAFFFPLQLASFGWTEDSRLTEAGPHEANVADRFVACPPNAALVGLIGSAILGIQERERLRVSGCQNDYIGLAGSLLEHRLALRPASALEVHSPVIIDGFGPGSQVNRP